MRRAFGEILLCSFKLLPTTMRKNIFVGAHATRERKAFYDFLKEHFPDKLDFISHKIMDMTFNDDQNRRTSKILQEMFVEIYEYFIKGNPKLEEELVNRLRIRYDKSMKPGDILSEIADNIKYRH